MDTLYRFLSGFLSAYGTKCLAQPLTKSSSIVAMGTGCIIGGQFTLSPSAFSGAYVGAFLTPTTNDFLVKGVNEIAMATVALPPVVPEPKPVESDRMRRLRAVYGKSDVDQ
jgi:hypothetical protein